MKRILLFSFILFLQENLSARLPDLIPYRKGNLWGYCDSIRKIIIPVKYDFAYDFSDGTAIVLYKNTQAIIDTAGNEIVLPDSMFIGSWEARHGVRIFYYTHPGKSNVFINGIYNEGLINDKGKIILEPAHASLYWISQNYLFACTDWPVKTAVYDFRGRQILGFDYQLYDFDPDNRNADKGQFILRNKRGRYGIVDTSGKVLTPFIYRFIWDIGCGYYHAEMKNSSDILDENGKKKWDEDYITDSIFKSMCSEDENYWPDLSSHYSAMFWDTLAAGPEIGLRTSNGDTLLTIINGSSWGFQNGDLAWVEECLDKNTKAKRDLGYIDIYGNRYWEN